MQDSLSWGLQLVMGKGLALLLSWPHGQLFQLLQVGEGKGRALTLHPHHHMPDDWWGQLYCAAQARWRASSTECGNLQGAGAALPTATGDEGQRGKESPPHLCHLTADERWGQLAPALAIRAGSPTPLPPGPASLSYLGKPQDLLSHMMPLVRDGANTAEHSIQ